MAFSDRGIPTLKDTKEIRDSSAPCFTNRITMTSLVRFYKGGEVVRCDVRADVREVDPGARFGNSNRFDSVIIV